MKNFYTKSDPFSLEARFDFCHFGIYANFYPPEPPKSNEMLHNPGQSRIVLRINKCRNINVYIWEDGDYGEMRPITIMNNPAEENFEYNVDINSGIFMVTVPKFNATETELDFDYWVDLDYNKTFAFPLWTPNAIGLLALTLIIFV